MLKAFRLGGMTMVTSRENRACLEMKPWEPQVSRVWTEGKRNAWTRKEQRSAWSVPGRRPHLCPASLQKSWGSPKRAVSSSDNDGGCVIRGQRRKEVDAVSFQLSSDDEDGGLTWNECRPRALLRRRLVKIRGALMIQGCW